MSEKKTLIIPINVKGIFVDKTMPTVGPTLDFSYLPWNDGKRDYNPDYAPIGKNIETTPLQTANGQLERGIHLHWNLPPALCQSIELSNGERATPYAPRLWHITPVDIKGTGSLPQETIMSDYLRGDIKITNKNGMIPIPYKPEEPHKPPFSYMGKSFDRDDEQYNNTINIYNKFIHESDFKIIFGRELDFLGYGSLEFAPFYPNCREIFGHYIPVPEDSKFDSVTYFVRAVYLKKKDNILGRPDPWPLNKFISDNSDALSEDSLKELMHQFGWPLGENDALPDEIHLAGTVEINFNEPANLNFDKSKENLYISMGNTGTEALSAQLAYDLSSEYGSRSRIEEQLEAIMLGDNLHGHAADLGLKFREARHEHGFKKVSGGNKWTLEKVVPPSPLNEKISYDRIFRDNSIVTKDIIRNLNIELLNKLESELSELYKKYGRSEEAPTIETLEEKFNSLSLSLKSDLNFGNENEQFFEFINKLFKEEQVPIQEPSEELLEIFRKRTRQISWMRRFNDTCLHLFNLNKAQFNYDKKQFILESQKEQLFGDWYKYMWAKYPPPESPEVFDSADFPTPGEIASLIEYKTEALIKNYNDLREDFWLQYIDSENSGERVNQQGKCLEEIKWHRYLINKEQEKSDSKGSESPKAVLVARPENPFFVPTEPVVLISGLNIQKPKPKTSVAGWYADISEPLSLDPQKKAFKIEKSIYEKFLELTKPDDDEDNPYINKGESKTFNPFILEWEAEFLPIVDITGNNAPQNRFTLEENHPDTQLRKTESYKHTRATTVRGRTFLTLGAKERKLKVLGDFLKLKLDIREDKSDYPSILKAAINYKKDQQRPFDANDALMTACRAFEKLYGMTVVSQALGGFNEALLQLETHHQPELQDRLGTEQEQKFTETTKELIGDEIKLAPNPGNPFLPVRAGSFKLLGIRLIDTWGRYRDLLKEQDLEPVLSEPLMPFASKPTWAGLNLRVVQPLRLHFNWIYYGDALIGSQKENPSPINNHTSREIPFLQPILGWIAVNHLDKSLMYYRSDGLALGCINRQGEITPPPGSKSEPLPYGLHGYFKHILLHAQDPDWLRGFIQATDNALSHIHPKDYLLNTDSAILTGRPLAVVRARISFELRGLPAQEHSWEILKKHIRSLEFGESDHETKWQNMKFPVRLGNYMQLNDGLVGFWIEKEDFGPKGPFYSMASETDRSDILPHDKEAVLWLPLNGDSVVVTMVIDPRGVVHATTGVLPVQSIKINPDHYLKPLSRISSWYLNAPILQPKGAEKVLTANPPEEPGFKWSWIEAGNDHNKKGLENEAKEWTTIENFEKQSPEATLKGENELREGWLKLNPK